MKRFKLQRPLQLTKLIYTLCLSLLFAPGYAGAANCSFYPGHHQTTITMQVPATLSIPRDTPNGTVIYESPPLTMGPTPSSYKCTNEFSYGVQNNVGVSKSGDLVYAIGNTGLAWQWSFKDDVTIPIYPGIRREAGGFGWDTTRHVLRLFKIADVIDVQRIPAGTLGTFHADGVSPLAMATNGTTIVPQSCETPDIKVDMGSHDMSSFAENGAYSEPVKFDISLNNCPPGIKKVTYTLKPTPTSPSQNSTRGIVQLSADSTAQGVALQVLNSDGNPLVLNQSYVFADYPSVGGNLKIPLSARYFRVAETGGNGGFDKGMRAGTANATIAFVMSYL
ncbi:MULTISPECIES: fimbrial protein [Pseudomonas]|uniref:fimbrial protein n=1 Tax=Pseudomonas germanica TaxID=2815720 RepID=UPI002A4E1B0A|nr:fimbrial protein [Pseudomonas germanica]WPN72687.1 fimbrial protein [Pseudomonas germanica]